MYKSTYKNLLTTEKPTLSTSDIMAHLKLSRETTLQLLRSGAIPSIRLESGRFRVDANVYEEWYKANYGGVIHAA